MFFYLVRNMMKDCIEEMNYSKIFMLEELQDEVDNEQCNVFVL